MGIQHKCPGCGSDLIFKPETGMLVCESCGHQENIDEMPSTNEGVASYDDFQSQKSSQT